VSANAGYTATLYTVGAATAMTNEACTDGGAHTAYQITSATKRILDPDTAIVVATQTAGAGDWNVDAAGTYAVEGLFGTITFDSAKGATDLVRVNSASYMPRLSVGLCTGVQASFARALLDTTCHGDSAPSVIGGLMGCSWSAEMIQDLQDDIDPGAGSVKLSTNLLNGTTMLLELTIGAGVWRAWVVPESADLKGPMGGLAGASIKFVGQGRQLVGRSEMVCWAHI